MAKKINAGRALEEIARKNGVSVEEVRGQITLAILAGMRDPSPSVQAYWRRIPAAREIPTPEEVIAFMAKEVAKKQT